MCDVELIKIIEVIVAKVFRVEMMLLNEEESFYVNEMFLH